MLIDKVNDQAQADYKPKPYDGRITLVRPKKHFAGLNHQDFGWGKFALKGVEIDYLPVSPRGMLIEPFVKLLSEKIKTKIDEMK